MKFADVTRVEVIDETGRAYVKYNRSDVEISIQDDGRTLKLFVGGGKSNYESKQPALFKEKNK